MNLELVSVDQIGGGETNDCSNNAIDATENGDGEVRTITGWLVHPYNQLTNITEIVQHWWNKHSSGRYFDTSPGVDIDCEYVVDLDLIHYFRKNYDNIDNNVAISLILSDGKFIGVDRDESSHNGLRNFLVSSLSTDVLYRQKA
jgi:hypothetical protein